VPTVAELSIEVTVKDQGAQEDILKLQQMLQRLATEDPDISVRVSADAAKKEFERLKEEMVWLEGNTVDIETDVQAKQAIAQLEELQRKMRELDRSTVGVDVDIDTTGALLHMAIFKEELKALSKEKIEVDKDQSAFKSLNQISAAAQRASGTIRGLTTAVIALGPGLVPIAAVGVTGLLAFAAAASAAGAGAALFAGVAITVFKPITDVIKKMTAAQTAYDQAVTDKQKETALAKLKALYESLDPAQQKLVTSFMALKKAWTDFAEQFRPEIFVMASEAMNALSAAIPAMTPLMQNATKAIHGLQTESIAAFKSPVWQEFFNNLTNNAGPAITSFGHILGNLATGFVGILNAFFPFQKGFLGGLEELTRKFAEWGATLGSNPGFQKFVTYIKENTPLVLNLLASLGKAFVALVIAAAPIGERVMQMLTQVFDGLTKLGEISPITLTGLLAFAGVSAVFVNMIGPILAVVNVVGLLLPIFSLIWSGISAGASAVAGISAAFFAWAGIIALVVGALILAYQNFDGFRAKVDEFVQKLKDIGQSILDTVGPAIQEGLKFLQEEWAKFVQWWDDNSATFTKAWDNIKTGAEFVLNWLVDEISGALDQIMSIWNAVWPGLSTILSGVWEVIKGVISGAFNIIRGIFTIFAAIFAGDWGKIWDGLVMILFGFWDIIWGILKGGFEIIKGIIQIAGAAISAAWSYIWDAIKGGATNAVEFLKSAWNGIVSFFQFLWDGIAGGAMNFINTIIGFFQWLYDVLIGNSIIPDLVNGVIEWWNKMVDFLMAVMQPVIDFVITAWNTIKDGVMTAVSAIWDTVSTIFTNVWNFLVTVWTNITSTVSTAIETVKGYIQAGLDFIQTIWNTAWDVVSTYLSTKWTEIKAFVQTGIDNAKAVIQTGLDFIKGIWDTAWDAVSTKLSAIWNTIKTNVSDAINTVRTTIEGVLNTIKALWDKIWNGLVDAVRTMVTNVMAAIRGIVSDITGAFTGLISSAYNWGKDLISGFIKGIESMAQAAGDAASKIIGKVASVMPGSPAETGPLSGHGYVKLRGQRFVQDLAAGLSATGPLSMTMSDIADIMSLNANPTAAFDAITSPLTSTAGAFGTGANGASAATSISVGDIVLQIPAGMDPAAARAAFDGAQDTMAEALLTAIQKRQSS
jgi:phage-related protein